MDARLNLYGNTVAAKFAKYINSAGAVVTGSALPAATQELVKIRASQINGCAACTDMHTKDAEHAGESPVRLNLVAVWREATVFTEAERAALELTEQGTRIADAAGGVTDEAWANAAKHYDDDQLAALVALIALINTYNRMNVITRSPPATTSPASGDNGPCATGQGLGQAPRTAVSPVPCARPPRRPRCGWPAGSRARKGRESAPDRGA